MNILGEYETGHLSEKRLLVNEFTEYSYYFNHIQGLFEIDITKARNFIREYKEKTGIRLSFTSWVMKCIAQAVSEFKSLQTFTKGRYSRKTITFHDVDVKCIVEKEIDGKKIPTWHIVRKANEKSYLEIHKEIREAQHSKETLSEKEKKIRKRQHFLAKLPRFIRKFYWRYVMNNPFQMKKHFGTIGLTSLGMFGREIRSGWGIPKTAHSTTFALGSICKKPLVNEDEDIIIREFLCMTLIVNHDTIDGAPAARFASRLNELMENGYGLPEDTDFTLDSTFSKQE
jgi:pyruvate/2-oxoglutarate dehydrogenase complex dihydrolipoamide acyltransferase (E2) component